MKSRNTYDYNCRHQAISKQAASWLCARIDDRELEERYSRFSISPTVTIITLDLRSSVCPNLKDLLTLHNAYPFGENSLESIKNTSERIKRLEIQGARNVAIAAIKSIETLAKETKAQNKKQLLNELSQARKILFESRETEPLMRNAIRLMITKVKKSRDTAVPKLAATIASASKAFLDDLEQSKMSIGEVGLKRIQRNATILTHCHSSTVTHVLRRAKEENIDFEIICTESRPMYQGRITVKEMLDLGVKTTLIVDSAVRFFMNRVDLVIVGADAITSEGNIINKIGTSTVALVAHEARTPFYVAAELLKYDPATIHGDFEKIEERKPEELWRDPPKNLCIRNPAFDVTRRDFIHGIICEEGIISPHSITEVMHRRYPWVFEQQ